MSFQQLIYPQWKIWAIESMLTLFQLLSHSFLKIIIILEFYKIN